MSTPSTDARTSPARTRTRKSPAQRSDEIHAAASDLARAEGLSALTLRAVAHRAGVAAGLVAHYTSGMDALVADVFTHLVGEELADVRAWLYEHPAQQYPAQHDPAQQLARLFETVLGGDRDDITLVWVDAWSRGRHNPALSAAIDTQMTAWHDTITEIIDAGHASGVFTTDAADGAAWQILAMIDGISAHALARGTDPAPFIRRLAAASEVLVGAATGTVTDHLTD